MHDVTVAPDEFSRPAVIRMLPILNLNPNDRNCIYIYMETALITFDQPLWVKAVEVVVEQQINVVSIWVLHATISCLSSVGIIMSGSAIEKALETCFGSLTVGHMLSGKCVSRAIRGHLFAESPLHSLLLHNFLTLSEESAAPEQLPVTAVDQTNLSTLCNKVSDKLFC